MSETEKRNPKSENIDILSTDQILHLMNEEDATVIDAVKAAIPFIAKAVDEAVKVIKNGGRIFYVGAGTSGRLGVLDASEIPPTFSVPYDLFRAIIAGGDEAIKKSIEGAEDDEDAGRNAASHITDKDMVVGISASGKTPFVLACLDAAKEKGAKCWLITCNDIETITSNKKTVTSNECDIAQKSGRAEVKTSELPNFRASKLPSFQPDSSLVTRYSSLNLDGVVTMITGPEIIAGSTRLKAGTATKLALNMFSTATMIKLDRVYRGLMVDVTPSNKKLIERAERIITEITGCSREEASKYLKLSGMKSKVAIVMKAKDVSKEDAERLLENAGNSLRKTLG